MASYELFLRGMLDKVGAYPDALHVGDYKTASNTYTEHTYTPAHREMAASLNTDLYEQLVRGLADGRHKSEGEVRTLIDHGPFLPEDALRAGLIDDLAYEDELDDKVQLATAARCTSSSRVIPADQHDVARSRSRPADRRDLRGRVDQLGQSSYDSPSGPVDGSDTLIDYLRKARADRSIKAIVLRIDSPGGSAIASDVIWREVMLTREPEAGHRLDVRRCGLRRLLHRHVGPRDRRRAGDPDRIDRRGDG